jgi:hypothetical protein
LRSFESTPIPNSFEPYSTPYGVSYGRWTVIWWQWLLSNPKATNPVLDSTGQYTSLNQPASDVWFLAGKLADTNFCYPHRVCAVPEGRSILFPVINCEANSFEYPTLKTQEDLIRHVKNDENTIIRTQCIVDGHAVDIHRIESDPLVFTLTIPLDNILGVEGGGSIKASADGYWVFLRPLPNGKHSISFAGSCETGRLNSGAAYDVTVR